MSEVYWRQKLAGFATPTELVIGHPLRRTGNTGTRSQARPHPASLAHKLAAFALLLARYNRTDDLILGVERGSPGDVIPLRVSIPESQSAADFLRAAAAEYASALTQPEALTDIQGWSEIPAGFPLFESAVVFSGHVPALPLILHATADALTVHYDAALFDEDSIGRMLGHLTTLLAGFAAHPDRPAGQIDLLTEAERTQILYGWNATAIDFPLDACLHTLFEANAASQPDKTALIFKGQSITYSELDRRANQVARHLMGLGVGPDVPVAIFIERSIEMVVGLYGVLKAGGCYVPVDPTYPEDRIAFMLADTQAPVILTQASLLPSLAGHAPAGTATLALDRDASAISAHPDTKPAVAVNSLNLAYIIYTSGSTGKPKGAMLNHQGRVNNFLDFNRRYQIGAGDVVLGLSSLSFDMSAYDIFGTLAAGGTTVIVEGEARLEPGRWADLLVRHGVTVWHSVPALLEMLVTHIETRPERVPHTLRLTLLGGDWIPVSLPDRIRALLPDIHNVSMGGATECSMDSTIYDITEPSSGWKSIPYGVPMANQLCYVLDDHLQPVPIGVPGELFLGGIGVGRGYLNRPELTGEKFIRNPYPPLIPPPQAGGDRGGLYRTGDLARYMPDGNLELLGRKDFQVKIRGFRIELGEIEAAIRQHPAVEEAVVLARQDDRPTRRLVAYLTQDASYLGQPEELQAWHDAQLAQWQLVYDTAYSRPPNTPDETFNIVSWDSSYTGQPIPALEMQQWVDTTVERIQRHNPRRVYEIGCGTGLLLFRIAPGVDSYRGTDFSPVALDYVQKHLPARNLAHKVTLARQLADDFTGVTPGSLDMVVLNSIILDFPSVDYLLEVLRGSARAVAPGGHIFVGDVRSLPLLETYHASVQLYRAPDDLSANDLRQRIIKGIRLEEELLFDPAFFAALPHWIPEISAVEIHLKEADYDNELSRFRFDVTLHVGPLTGENTAPEIDWLDWGASTTPLSVNSLEGLRTRLGEPRPLGVRGIPNALVTPHVQVAALIAESNGNAKSLRAALDKINREAPGVQPAALWGFRDTHWVNVQPAGQAGFMEAVFIPKTMPRPLFPHTLTVDAAQPPQAFANNPLRGKLARSLIPEIRAWLEGVLPDYMVPSAFVLMDAFPLSPNGKINRRAFPAPDSVRPEMAEAFVAPRTPVERVLGGIWCDGLGLEQVGIHDRFIALGGHSLLATQVVSRIRDIFQVEMPLSYGFNATIVELADKLAEMGGQIGLDMTEVAEMFIEISQLSDEEVSALLEAETA